MEEELKLSLFVVYATYAKKLKPNGYIVTALNKKDAKKQFQNQYTGLNIISDIKTESEDIELIMRQYGKWFPTIEEIRNYFGITE